MRSDLLWLMNIVERLLEGDESCRGMLIGALPGYKVYYADDAEERKKELVDAYIEWARGDSDEVEAEAAEDNQ